MDKQPRPTSFMETQMLLNKLQQSLFSLRVNKFKEIQTNQLKELLKITKSAVLLGKERMPK